MEILWKQPDKETTRTFTKSENGDWRRHSTVGAQVQFKNACAIIFRRARKREKPPNGPSLGEFEPRTNALDDLQMA
jgi:hypothetical protein